METADPAKQVGEGRYGPWIAARLRAALALKAVLQRWIHFALRALPVSALLKTVWLLYALALRFCSGLLLVVH